MNKVDVDYIKEALETMEEVLNYFKERIEQGDIDGLIIRYSSDYLELKDKKNSLYLRLKEVSWGTWKLYVEKDEEEYIINEIDGLDKHIIDYLFKELYYLYNKVLEILRDEIKKEFGGDSMDKDKEIITNEFMVHIYKIGGVKKVRVVFCKDMYDVGDIKNIINRLDGVSGDVLVLEGRAPIWLYTSIAVYLKNMFKKIMVFDPKLNGYVVVYSLDNLGLGKIEKEE